VPLNSSGFYLIFCCIIKFIGHEGAKMKKKLEDHFKEKDELDGLPNEIFTAE